MQLKNDLLPTAATGDARNLIRQLRELLSVLLGVSIDKETRAVIMIDSSSIVADLRPPVYHIQANGAILAVFHFKEFANYGDLVCQALQCNIIMADNPANTVWSVRGEDVKKERQTLLVKSVTLWPRS